MAAPEYVPTILAQQPRRGLPLPPARSWRADRPADLGPAQPSGTNLGNPGPDQGYALLLAARFRDRLVLGEGEHSEDASAGCVGVSLRRASLYGRAPVVHDLDLAFTVWGFLSEAPNELIAHRRTLFAGAAHHYHAQRAIAEAVPEATLRLSLDALRSRSPADWANLLEI